MSVGQRSKGHQPAPSISAAAVEQEIKRKPNDFLALNCTRPLTVCPSGFSTSLPLSRSLRRPSLTSDTVRPQTVTKRASDLLLIQKQDKRISDVTLLYDPSSGEAAKA